MYVVFLVCINLVSLPKSPQDHRNPFDLKPACPEDDPDYNCVKFMVKHSKNATIAYDGRPAAALVQEYDENDIPRLTAEAEEALSHGRLVLVKNHPTIIPGGSKKDFRSQVLSLHPPNHICQWQGGAVPL
jgi:hypothetical protein